MGYRKASQLKKLQKKDLAAYLYRLNWLLEGVGAVDVCLSHLAHDVHQPKQGPPPLCLTATKMHRNKKTPARRCFSLAWWAPETLFPSSV